MTFEDLFNPSKVYLSVADRKRAKRGELPLRFQRVGEPEYMSYEQSRALRDGEREYPEVDSDGRIIKWVYPLNVDELRQKQEEEERKQRAQARLPQHVRDNPRPGREHTKPDRSK